MSQSTPNAIAKALAIARTDLRNARAAEQRSGAREYLADARSVSKPHMTSGEAEKRLADVIAGLELLAADDAADSRLRASEQSKSYPDMRTFV